MNSSKTQDLFGNELFDVEHALGMYASSFFTIPAAGIYENELLKQYKSIIDSCHIYIIGFLPIINTISVKQKDNKLILTLSIFNDHYDLVWQMPDGTRLIDEPDLYYIEDKNKNRYIPDNLEIMKLLSDKSGALNFNIQYIGQAYGKDGSRNALDRLLKHETLQKISLKGIPEGFTLSLLLLEVQPSNQLFTFLNPFAKNKDNDGQRIRAGIDKLYDTTEQERITLYEASLIRYFLPAFNKEFKDSFPSTNLKVLQGCYDKDFAAVIAEICIDELPFKLYSDSIKPSNYHIAKHDLHKDASRKAFFFA